MHMCVALVLWINTVYNYCCATLKSPGRLPASDSVPSDVSPDKYCDPCKTLKRSHAHHCRDCKACVPYMDHHCPFTMNCVGRDNFHYFFLFLAYVSAGLAYSAWLTFPLIRMCWLDFVAPTHHYVCQLLGNMSLICIASVGLWLCTTCLCAIQVGQLLLDWSTLASIKFLQTDCSLATLRARLGQARFRNPDSRLHVLLLSRRPRLWHWFIPFTEPQ